MTLTTSKRRTGTLTIEDGLHAPLVATQIYTVQHLKLSYLKPRSRRGTLTVQGGLHEALVAAQVDEAQHMRRRLADLRRRQCRHP